MHILVSYISALWFPAAAADFPIADKAMPAELVQRALNSEIKGDDQLRDTLLYAAVARDSDHGPAHWHLGRLQVDGRWLPAREAQAAAAANSALVEYYARRNKLDGSVDAEINLAQWCRKQGLGDQERFHWLTVLSSVPQYEPALRRLGLRWFGGRLLTHEQIVDAKQFQKNVRDRREALAARWESQIEKWIEALGTDGPARNAARAEIRLLSDPEATDFLVNDIATIDADVGVDVVQVLGRLPAKAGTDAVVWLALTSEWPEVRAKAAQPLKSLPVHDFVPRLLALMQMPIESDFVIGVGPDGTVHYQHELRQEGAETHVERALLHSTVLHNASPFADAPIGSAAAHGRLGYSRDAAALEQTVARTNARIREVNRRVHETLTATTGVEGLQSPAEWWDWWQDYNELETAEPYVDRESSVAARHRVFYQPPPAVTLRGVGNRAAQRYRAEPYRSYAQHTSQSMMRVLAGPRGYSCFAADTKVWCETGQVAIGDIKIGDRVLSQDIGTGELSFKHVIGTTVRPPAPTRQLMVGTDRIVTTLGHPLWVTGTGWRMAKFIQPETRVRALDGSTAIFDIQEGEPVEAHNLVVADNHTYFVGESAILVHDNTLRTPTAAVLPGFQDH